MTDIDTAFEMLQEAVGAAINITNDKAVKALKLGDHSQATEQVEKSKALTTFKKQVLDLQKDYKKIGTPQKKRRARRGSSTPQEDYYEPLLTALREAGGRGTATEITDRVGEIMGAKLENETDQGRLSNGFIRWRHRCGWARWRLIKQGKLKKDSPRGIWELA